MNGNDDVDLFEWEVVQMWKAWDKGYVTVVLKPAGHENSTISDQIQVTRPTGLFNIGDRFNVRAEKKP